MNNSDLNKKLNELDIEDFIWIIYIGIIILSFYSNHLERDYYINKNNNSKNKYNHINIIIFSIALVVYLYFLKSSYESYKNLNSTDSDLKKRLVTLSFIGSLLFAISGAIILYVAINNDSLDVELAFN